MVGFFIFMFLIIGAAIAIAVVIGTKRNKVYTAEGKIIKRDINFYKNKQFFKSFINDQQAFFNALTAAAQGTGICSVSGNYGSTVIYKGKTWTARLERLQSNDGSLMFSYALSQYDEYRGLPKNIVDFNIMLTAIEKVFLQFDPGTQITEQAIAFKSC